MAALFAYVIWMIFSSMTLRWGIYLGIGKDIGIISPILIITSLQIFIAPFFIKNKQ